MEHLSSTIPYLSIAIPTSLLYNVLWGNSQPAPFPPGPAPLPLIGNLKDMPKTRTHKTFEKWAKTYGDIVHVNVLGNHIIVLNSPKYVYDILESKNRIYSGRPISVMAGQMIGWDGGTAIRQPDSTWAVHRKYMHDFIGNRSKVEEFENVIEEEVRKLLPCFSNLNTLNARDREKPELLELFHLYTASVVVMLVYGYQVTDENDQLVKQAHEAMDNFSETTQTGAFAVDVFPLLRFVPSWFPGASWKAKGLEYRGKLDQFLKRPYNWTKKQMELGTARPCFLTNVLEERKYSEEEEKVLQWIAITIYTAGAHPTAAELCCFILGIVRHTPELQRAQAEIRQVIGNDRLPTFEDRPRLPYFEALCMEIFRWYSVVPTSLPHVLEEDDIHDGYFIPKGSIVLANNLGLYRNEELYPNPYEFKPERFLEFDADGRRKQPDPRNFLFGYGRRACPGMYLATGMLWRAAAALITVFDFKPVTNKDGKPVLPLPKFVGDLLTNPEPFNFVITPRSDHHCKFSSEYFIVNKEVALSEIRILVPTGANQTIPFMMIQDMRSALRMCRKYFESAADLFIKMHAVKGVI